MGHTGLFLSLSRPPAAGGLTRFPRGGRGLQAAAHQELEREDSQWGGQGHCEDAPSAASSEASQEGRTDPVVWRLPGHLARRGDDVQNGDRWANPGPGHAPLPKWKGVSPIYAARRGSLGHYPDTPPGWAHVDRCMPLPGCTGLGRSTGPPSGGMKQHPQEWQARCSEDHVQARPSAPAAGKVIPSQVKEKAPQPKIAALPSCHTV